MSCVVSVDMIFYLIFWGFLLHLGDVCCTSVIGNCSINLPPEQFEVSGTQRDVLNCRLYKTGSCMNGTHPLQGEGPFTGPPTSLEADGQLIPDPRNNLSPQLSIEWTSPNDENTIRNLQGFLLRLGRYSSVNGSLLQHYCRIFDLSETRFHRNDTKLKFKKEMIGFPGGSDIYYKVEISTLPPSPNEETVTRYFTLQPSQNSKILHHKDWSPFISYDEVNFTEPASFTVRFKVAERKFNFTVYKVELLSVVDPQNVKDTCLISVKENYTCQNEVYEPPFSHQRTVTVRFFSILEGRYYIRVQPFDPYWQNDDRCLCRNLPSGRCTRCMTTRTAVFTVNGHPVTKVGDNDTCPTNPAYTVNGTDYTSLWSSVPARSILAIPDNNYKIIAAVGGIGFGLILVTIIVVRVCRKRSCLKEPDEFGYINGEYQNNLSIDHTDAIKLLIVNTEENDPHKLVIGKFAIYLQKVCLFHVSHLMFENDMSQEEQYQWVIRRMDMVNFIIVVNSKVAFKTYQDRMSDNVRSDVFSFAVSHMLTKSREDEYRRKIIFIHFEYTEEESLILDINPRAQYKIPDQLKELLCCLHRKNEDYICEFNTIGDLNTSSDGRDLRESIRKYPRPNRQSGVTSVALNPDEVLGISSASVVDNSHDFYPPRSVTDVSSSVAMERLADINGGTINLCQRKFNTTNQTQSTHHFIDPSVSGTSEASTNCLNERIYNITDQYERMRENNQLQQTSAPWRTQKKHHVPDDCKSDISSFWKAPSTVESEITTSESVTMEKLASINAKSELNTNDYNTESAESVESCNVDSAIHLSDSFSPHCQIVYQRETCAVNCDEPSRLSDDNREEEKPKYTYDSMKTAFMDGPSLSRDSGNRSCSFYSPSEPDSDMTVDDIFQTFHDINNSDYVTCHL